MQADPGCRGGHVVEHDGRFYPSCPSLGIFWPTFPISLSALAEYLIPDSWVEVPYG